MAIFRVSDDWYISLFSYDKTSFCINRIYTCTDYYLHLSAVLDWKLGEMMLEGVTKVTPTGIMIGFSILYFGLMIDRGLI